MSLRVVTEPTVEPLTLAEIRLHLGETVYDTDGHPNDALFTAAGIAARSWAEEFTGLALAPTDFELLLDAFPEESEIELPRPPVLEITSVQYIDQALDTQTVSVANYSLDHYQRPGWLLPAPDFSWPATAAVANAVRVRYRSGFVSLATTDETSTQVLLPGAIKAALSILVGVFYRQREDAVIPEGVKSLLRPFRINTGMA